MDPWEVRVGPLAVGAGAVWVGTRRGTVTVRVDPVGMRVTARFGGHAVVVAHGVLWSYCCRRGDTMMGFGRVDARTLRARPPLVVTNAAGRRQPVGALAVGADAVWTLPLEGGRLWRVPLAGGPARALQVAGFPYGLAVDGGAVWVLSGTGDSGSGLDRAGRLCTWTPAPVRSPTPRRCRRWMLAGSMSRWGRRMATVPCGWPVRTRGGRRVAAFCCGSIPSLGGWPGGSATRARPSRVCLPTGRAGRGRPPRHPYFCT